MLTLDAIEEKHDFTFPSLYRKLWEDGMLNYMRGFDEPLKEGETWANTVYPALKEKPPILLHTGESQMTILTPQMMLDFEFPPFWDVETHHFIPFAKTLEGNYFAFYNNVKIEGQIPVVEIWDEMDDTVYYAKNFETFIVRQMIESANDIDKDDLKVDYHGEMDAYLADARKDIDAIVPYISPEYVELLREIYGREAKEDKFSYYLIEFEEMEDLVEEKLGFEKMDESFSHELN